MIRPGPRALAFRLAVAGLVGLGVAAAWRWRGVFDPVAISATIARSPAAPLSFLALQVAASLIFVPRTLLGIAAGLLFGLWWGTVWAALGSVAGAAAGFLLARYVTGGPIEAARLAPAFDRVAQGGWRMVALLRLAPVVPHSLANYALAMTPVPLGAYALGSLIGQLPMTVAAVAGGAAGKAAMLGGASWLAPTAIGVSALALSLAFPAVARRRARRAAARP